MTDDLVPHPNIPGWVGTRSWSAPGTARSQIVVWDTDEDVQPFRMTHNRDLIMDGAEVEQDYNYIDYCFGDPNRPVSARHYLGDRHVFVDLPGPDDTQLTIEQAKELMPSEVLAYLQKRFDQIEVLVSDGYKVIWSI